MSTLTITFLGTGTSTGIPEIGCTCDTCQSTDPKDKRLRSSIWLQTDTESILIDTTPDLRQQCLREKIPDVDAVFYTHLHADHFFGLDDLRRYNWIHKKEIDVFVPFFMENQFKSVFGYTIERTESMASLPKMRLNLIDEEPHLYKELKITPLPITHGGEEIRGFLFEFGNKKIAYLTDCKSIPERTKQKLQGLDVLILGAIWKDRHKHHKHFDLEEALEMSQQIKPKKLYLTHLSHHMKFHQELEQQTPAHVHTAFDGLKLTFEKEI